MNAIKNIKKPKYKILRIVLTYLILTLGTILAAFALESFLIPNSILDGGVTGISMIFDKVTPFNLATLIIIINIPFIFIGFKNLGTHFLARTIYSIGMFSLFLTVFRRLDIVVTDEVLLALTFGGVLLGASVGLIMRMGGCIDGTESVALVISKKTSLSTGQIVLIFNLFIYAASAPIYGIERAMYSLLTYFITFNVIDFVSEGMEQAKAALIITEKENDIAAEIYKQLGRTTTMLDANGFVSGKKEVLYCVLTRIEISELKSIIEEIDSKAFVTIMDVSEIIGNHIKKKEQKVLDSD